MSSAVCLVGLALFAATGITLNNADAFEANEPRIERQSADLPATARESLAEAARRGDKQLPQDVERWMQSTLGVKPATRRLEWRADELSISMPRPGADAWMRIDVKTGRVEFERTGRGAIALLNDLHKGRHAGPVWGWFIDLFAAAALISALTGLLILTRQSATRPLVWPLVAIGFAIPAVIALVYVH